MRRISLVTAALGLAALLTTAASARDKGKPEPAACGDYGTSVHFEKTPSDAAKRAQKEEKLVFVLRVSGDFEKSELT